MTSSAVQMTRPAGRAAVATVQVRVGDPLTAAGLRRWLRSSGQAQSAHDGGPCDVVVLGVAGVPATWLRRTIASVRAETSAQRVVVVADGAAGPVPSVAEVGCEAVLLRSTLCAETFEAAVCAGVCDDRPGDPLAGSVEDADERAATVLRMLADGHDLAEIAAALFYSERTVKNVLYGYLGKVGARNRVHAVACAIRAGLV